MICCIGVEDLDDFVAIESTQMTLLPWQEWAMGRHDLVSWHSTKKVSTKTRSIVHYNIAIY